jgi:hypothetical protein
MFGNRQTVADFTRREEFNQGRIVRYSNPARRRGTVAMLLIAAVAIFFILLKGGPEGPALVVFFFPIWITCAFAFGWTRLELTLDRDRRVVTLVKSPLLGDRETREIRGEDTAGIKLVKDEAWEVWIQSKETGSRCMDSSDDDEPMRRLARDLSETLGVAMRDGTQADADVRLNSRNELIE